MKILPVYENNHTIENPIRIPYKPKGIAISTYVGNTLSPLHIHAAFSVEHVHSQLKIGIWTRVEYATTTDI